ncbi:hypothetical protein [Microbacterium sp. SS28]|uniref:hypothetical protein n=1 Tax=Microbacterium sp. SS28 TaxID=2919948 RepID=UPI001FAA7D17|nr:hypothetical protein [Microbacterium sp. SS28]
MPTGQLLRAGALLALLALLSGCDTGRGDDPGPGPLPDGVSVQFVQLRSDVASRQGQVRVHNGADEAIQVGDVVMKDDGFPAGSRRVNEGRTSTIAPGRTVDIRVQLAPADCDASQGDTRVWLDVHSVAGGAAASLPDPLDVLGPLHDRECRAEQVADAVALSFSSFIPSPPGEPAALTLTLEPTGDAAARIDSIHSTNLLTWAGDATIHPLEIAVAAGDATPVELTLPLVPLRCDPHAVQEDKRGTVFTLDVEVGGEPGTIELPASEEMRGAILTWVAGWCGFGSP